MTSILQQRIMKLIQEYEELGSTETTQDYIIQLTEIRDELNRRILNAAKLAIETAYGE